MTWYFSVSESESCLGKYVAIGKREPIVGNGQPNDEDGDMCVSYGATADEAVLWLFRSLNSL